MTISVDEVAYDPPVASRADVVVIGGGIIGIATALALAERGISVIVCEKGRVGGEQSGRNWGWCRTMGRDPRELPLSIEALRMWREIEARHGISTGFTEAGTLYACDDEAAMATQETWLGHARDYQLDCRLIGREEVAALLPGSARRFAGGLYTPGDGRAEPSHAAPALAKAARHLGVKIFGNCAVRGVETQAGRVATVVTEAGRIECQSVVLAGGAWSRLFCGNLGIELPQLKVLASVLRTTPVEGQPDCAVGASDVALRKRADGGYTVARRGAVISDIVPDSFRLLRQFLPAWRRDHAELRLRLGARFIEEWRVKRRWRLDETTPFEMIRELDPEPNGPILDEAWANLVRSFPAFAKAEVAARWGGYIDVTPDAVPVISGVESLPGFFIATGFSGHGFGIAPAAGRLMADLVTGAPPVVDPSPYDLRRFN